MDGTILKEGDTVTLSISTGAGAIQIEDVTGYEVDVMEVTEVARIDK